MIKTIFLFLAMFGIFIVVEPLSARPSPSIGEDASLPSRQKNAAFSERNSPTEKFNSFTGKVSGSSVRMRLQPNLDGHIVRELNKGEMLLISGEENGFYAALPTTDLKAYVFRTYVLDNTIEGSNVNVRLDPHRDGVIIAQLNTGDSVKGKIDPNSKWIEISPPESTRFYVAKEYITKEGGPELLSQIEEKRNEAQHLLNSSYLTAQAEMRKPFEEINLERITEPFEKITSNYADFPKYAEKAKEISELMQETYLQKKIAFLEEKTMQSSEDWSHRNLNLQKEISLYEDRLAKLEEDLGLSTGRKQEPSHSVDSENKDETQKRMPLLEKMNYFGYSKENLPMASEKDFEKGPQTDKMWLWEPLERSHFYKWATKNPEKTIDDFYLEEQFHSTSITGIIEPFSRPIKNKPGDYVLKKSNRTIAYLYSTKINLQEKVGQQVTLNGNLRPNNHFAFPAYHVLSLDP